MVTVYIIIPYIIIELIRAGVYFGRRSFFTKLIYPQVIKDLFYNLIIFYKGNYLRTSSIRQSGSWSFSMLQILSKLLSSSLSYHIRSLSHSSGFAVCSASGRYSHPLPSKITIRLPFLITFSIKQF